LELIKPGAVFAAGQLLVGLLNDVRTSSTHPAARVRLTPDAFSFIIISMKYVALLRGINVGGNAKVEMPRLKAVIEKLGGQEVRTYINSGNVVFRDERKAGELEKLIGDAIEKEFKLKVPVILRDQKNIDMLCAKIPDDWTNDKQQKTDVLFLWHEIDSEELLKKVVTNPEIEKVVYLPGALVWNIGREHIKPGAGLKLVKSDIYPKMTIRNINTVRKLNHLMLS
jgi:uncharacterized protein (DUF1697 family)